MHFKSRSARHGLATVPIFAALYLSVSPAALAQIAPASATIGNQATAVYQTPDGTTVTVQSNLVETIVNQVAAVDLESAFDSVQAGGADDALVGAKPASTAGGVVTFPHTVENLGNGTDVFSLTTAYGGGGAGLTNIQIFADANADGVADSLSPITQTPALAPGETFGFVVQANLPAGLAAGELDDPVTVTATSQFDATQLDAVSDDIAIQDGPLIVTNKSMTPDAGQPGDVIIIELSYQNTGNTAGVARLKDALPPELEYMPGTAIWSAGTGAPLTEIGTDGAEQTAGTGDTIDYSVDLASVLGVDDMDGDAGTDLNTVLFEIDDVQPGTSGVVRFSARIAATAQSGTYRNGVYSCDETTGGADCDPTTPGPNPPFVVNPSLGVTLADSQSVADTPRAGAGLADPYADPVAALGGALVSGTGAGADTDGDTTNDVVEDDGTNGNTTDPVTSNPAWAEGSEVPFSFVLSNDSNATETFNLSQRAETGLVGGVNDFPAATVFRFETPSGLAILDNDGDGNPDVILDAGDAVEVVLIAKLPVGETRAATDPAWVREVVATSQTDVTLANESVASLTAAVVSDTVDLQNGSGTDGAGNSVAATGSGAAGATPDADMTLDGTVTGDPLTTLTADPGQLVEFSLPVVNTSAQSQSFNLTYSGVAPTDDNPADGITGDVNEFQSGTGLPSGWQVEFRVGSVVTANTGVIAAGATANVTARITIPADAAAGDQDIWFKVASTTSGAFDIKLDRVTVNPIVDLELTPDQSAQAAPGGTAVTTHTLTNTGNIGISDGGLTTTSPYSTFPSDVFVDVDGDGVFSSADVPVTTIAELLTAVGDANGVLDPGESYTLLHRAQVPAAAIAGQTEQATITVEASLSDDGGNPVTDGNTSNNAVEDTLSVVSGDVELVKLQGVDANCDGDVTDPGDQPLGQVRLNAGPTECLIYEVTATNTGTGNANNVELRDTTPVYTTFENTPGVLSVTTTGAGPAVFTATPSQGGTGDVIATVGVLQPGDEAVMTFEVEVDGNLPNTAPGAPTPLQ